MQGAVMFFREGGVAMWFVLLFGIAGLVVSGLFASSGESGLKIAAAAVLGVLVLAGIGGTMMGRRATEQAIANVEPSQKAMIMEAGYSEAMRPVQLMVGLAVPIALLFVVGMTRKRS